VNTNVILLTGHPGCGKTTLVRRVVEALGLKAGGFYTEEMRAADGRRTGFEIVTLDGQRGILAATGLRSRYRVGRYGVDVEGIDALAVPAIERSLERCELTVIDEIGKMELYSELFRSSVVTALTSGKCILATIMRGPHPFADTVRALPAVGLIEVTPANREVLLQQMTQQLEACLRA
jgi:nucleoside-triphosphatase